MPQPKPTNPFYLALIPVGVIFGITACSYMVMAYRGLSPHNESELGLPGLMNHWGMAIMGVELGLLAVLTVAAIGSDDFWTRRFAAAQNPTPEGEREASRSENGNLEGVGSQLR
ncbi:MAG TPA: hypothetical protein VFV87_13905 [Pirellulaceae bacterium]|nr:hypothetical protein [Pirellulaceae bacterium]